MDSWSIAPPESKAKQIIKCMLTRQNFCLVATRPEWLDKMNSHPRYVVVTGSSQEHLPLKCGLTDSHVPKFGPCPFGLKAPIELFGGWKHDSASKLSKLARMGLREAPHDHIREGRLRRSGGIRIVLSDRSLLKKKNVIRSLPFAPTRIARESK
jgi:hypothetical protein